MTGEALREIFGHIEKRFQKGVLDRDISYYFTFGDGPGEKWTVRLGPETCDVKEGKHIDKADCVVKTTSAFLIKMIDEGYVPGFTDFLQGRIRSNDPWLLRHLKTAIAL